MGASLTLPGWSFHDRSLTNAEIVINLYRSIRLHARESTWIIGCNTVGHLSAGIFEASRTGDDVSGREWERTRRMGVNTLAFRLPQNNTFFLQDADCVPVTKAIDWVYTEQWLNAVASSGSALILSLEPEAVGSKQKEAMREAISVALSSPSTEPFDWTSDTSPTHWRSVARGGSAKHYNWNGSEGASPFPLS
jgi:alpha-galactosidase